MKIIFDPFESAINKYVAIMTRAYRENGHEVRSLKNAFLNPFLLFHINLIHLNWFENVAGANKFAIYKNFLRKIIQLIVLKLMGKKIIWTMHNVLPHERGYFNLNFFLLKRIVYWSHRIVVHNMDSIASLKTQFDIGDDKFFYIPHPNYIGEYGDYLKAATVVNTKLKMLFFGAVKPYKNIELLIKVIKSLSSVPLELGIVGKPASIIYKKKLEDLVEDTNNVKLDLRFVNDQEIPELFSYYDVIVLPYDQTSSLNSGSAYLAFSYKKTIICPKIGTINDLKERDKVFSYTYKTVDDHFDSLRKAVISCFETYTSNGNSLTKYGHDMYLEVKEKNSFSELRNKLSNLLSS